DHPTAEKWLAKLDELDPPRRAASHPIILVAGSIIAVSMLLLTLFLVSTMMPRAENVPTAAILATQPASNLAAPQMDAPPTVEHSPTSEMVIQPSVTISEITPTSSVLSADAQAWRMSERVSIIDDTVTIALIRDADIPVATWLST